jgi:hypothetical protein
MFFSISVSPKNFQDEADEAGGQDHSAHGGVYVHQPDLQFFDEIEEFIRELVN